MNSFESKFKNVYGVLEDIKSKIEKQKKNYHLQQLKKNTMKNLRTYKY